VFGNRQRKYIDTDGNTKTLLIRRLRCTSCGKIHHELPDILVPYKRHCAETIEQITDKRLNSSNCDANLVYRILLWWRSMSIYFKGVMSALRAKFGAVISASPPPKELVRAAANAHLWKSTRSAYLSG
jgi:hypothetical protein